MQFLNYLPLEKGGALHYNKLEFPSPKDASCQVWLKLTQWFWRRKWKCEKFTDRRTDRQTDGRTDRRRTTGDQRSSFELKRNFKTWWPTNSWKLWNIGFYSFDHGGGTVCLRAFALHAEGWMFVSKLQRSYIIAATVGVANLRTLTAQWQWVLSIGQNLKSFTGNCDISIGVKNSWVGRDNNK